MTPDGPTAVGPMTADGPTADLGKHGRVLVVGSLNVDVTTTVERHPGPGETVLGEGLTRSPGGKGANQAVAAAAAGARTRMVGAVGADSEGAAYRAGLSGQGVDTSAVRVVDGLPTGTALVLLDPAGENCIVVIPGANAAVSAADVDAALGAEAPDVVLLQHEVPSDVVAYAVRAGVAAGARVVLNVAPYADLPVDVLILADPVVANEHEAEQLALLGLDLSSLLVTRGAAGATWTRGGVEVTVTAPVVQAVDTTGAGDAFCGALAAALAAGLDDRAALEAGVAAGADAVTRRGAQPWTF